MQQSCNRCGLLHPLTRPCFALQLVATPASDSDATQHVLAGRYQIVRRLHEGGMSVVYLANDLLQRRPVVLKELRLPYGTSAQDIEEAERWFARESYLLSSLNHPLIPTFYSVFREESRSFLVQEYVDGENLEELLRARGPMDARTVGLWGQALCDLLSYLHRRPEPVIFRDLKPSNILLRNDGRLAVVDFGIARPYVPRTVGTVIGSPGYAPPEQYQGMAAPQSDLYALGATLHRLLTGYDPEQGAPFTFPHATELQPGVSTELSQVLARAVAVVPEKRYPTADAMRASLRSAVGVSGDLWGLRRLEQQITTYHSVLRHTLPVVGAVLATTILSLGVIHLLPAPEQSSPYGSGTFEIGNYISPSAMIVPERSGYVVMQSIVNGGTQTYYMPRQGDHGGWGRP